MKNQILALSNIFSHPLNKGNFIKTLLKLIWWKINQITFNIPCTIELEKNILCICYPNSSYGSLIVYTRYPEYYELMFTKLFLKSNSIFFDVGAGFGDYSLVAASSIKKGKIYSFEPLNEEIKRLQQNIKINNLEKIISVNNNVVSNTNGYVNFLVSKVNEMSHIALQKTELKNSIKKKSVSINNFVKKQKIKNINLLKIDVEGAEYKVLKGANELLKKQKIDVMIVEFNSNQRNNDSYRVSLIEYLENLNYFTYSLEKNGLVRIKDYSFVKTRNLFIINNNKTLFKRVNKIINKLLLH
jgi:FkbM family methyltransferase